jgi:DegV family protein with EDD domain
MNKIGIIIDKGSDVNPDVFKKNQIKTVDFQVNWPPEMQGIPGETIFHKMQETDKRGMKIFCKTSQPSPKAFLDPFKQQLEKFEKIICLTVTSKLSGTYNSAVQARNFLPEEQKNRVFIVDTLNAASGESLILLKAIDLVNQGKQAEEIVKQLEELVSQTFLYIALEDPKWLETSGRISSTVANWIRKMSNVGLRAILGMKKGVLKPLSIKIGVKDVAEALFKQLESKSRKPRKQGKKIKVFISHALAPEMSKKLQDLIEKNMENTEIVAANLLGQIIGSIIGPGAMAVAWHAE